MVSDPVCIDAALPVLVAVWACAVLLAAIAGLAMLYLVSRINAELIGVKRIWTWHEAWKNANRPKHPSDPEGWDEDEFKEDDDA